MANTKRRLEDSEGKMFMPMTVDGGVSEEHFLDSTKLIVLALLAAVNLFMLLVVWDSVYYTVWWKVFWTSIMAIISSIVIRYAIFQERYYFRMYKKMKKYKVTTPAPFWDIVAIKNTDNGSILTYSDLKIGVITKLERDTIAGKPDGFREQHYDAVSDFYRSLNIRGYKYIQMNLMEQAGKDPRFVGLTELALSCDNDNIRYLLEKQISHMKSRSRITLTESDYFLVYTRDQDKGDVIIRDVADCMTNMMDGGFVAFDILDAEDCIALLEELYGVRYFDTTRATLSMFASRDENPPFVIAGVKYKDGTMDMFDLDSDVMSDKVENPRKKNKSKVKKKGLFRNKKADIDERAEANVEMEMLDKEASKIKSKKRRKKRGEIEKEIDSQDINEIEDIFNLSASNETNVDENTSQGSFDFDEDGEDINSSPLKNEDKRRKHVSNDEKLDMQMGEEKFIEQNKSVLNSEAVENNEDDDSGLLDLEDYESLITTGKYRSDVIELEDDDLLDLDDEETDSSEANSGIADVDISYEDDDELDI